MRTGDVVPKFREEQPKPCMKGRNNADIVSWNQICAALEMVGSGSPNTAMPLSNLASHHVKTSEANWLLLTNNDNPGTKVNLLEAHQSWQLKSYAEEACLSATRARYDVL